MRGWEVEAAVPDHPAPCSAILPPAHTPVQTVVLARSSPVSACLPPDEHTAPPPRPALGHGASAAITPRRPRWRRRARPLLAAPGSPPAPAQPKAAPSPEAPARSPPGRGSPPAPAGLPSPAGTPAPRSRTCAARRRVLCREGLRRRPLKDCLGNVRSTSPSPLPRRPPQEAAEGLSWQRAQQQLRLAVPGPAAGAPPPAPTSGR